MEAAAADDRSVGDADEAVHAPAVDVLLAGERAVRAARVVGAVRVEERLHAASDSVRHAHRRHAVLHRDPVGVGIGAEEGVEGAVLLHDHDHVADLVDVACPPCVPRARHASPRGRGAATRRPEDDEQQGDGADESQLNGGWSGRMSGRRGF